MSNAIVFCFDSPEAAQQASEVMKAADPSMRLDVKRATIFVTWHANIFAASMALARECTDIEFDMVFAKDFI